MRCEYLQKLRATSAEDCVRDLDIGIGFAIGFDVLKNQEFVWALTFGAEHGVLNRTR
jgi:hypothetical protein